MVPINLSLQGKVAIVTGGSKGIGRAIADIFAEHGADVALAARGEEELRQAAQAISRPGRRVIAVPSDVAETADREALVRRTIDALGGVDILVNNAAFLAWGPLATQDRARFLLAMETNVWAALHLAQLCRDSMIERGGGVILNMSSNQALRPDCGIGSYALTKAALVNLTKLLAKEWAGDGIRVAAIAPGLVRTDFAADRVAEVEKTGAPINALMRVGEAHEVAGLALVLASPAGAFATGSAYVLDGGELTCGPEDGLTLASGVPAAGKRDL
jgi:NAD(P)-dependent dehydrogenase (short-subunit alcohol dehydrogenase family)